jgi:hypothetical protein
VPSNVWITQELIYKTSGIDTADGVWKYYRWCTGNSDCTQSGARTGGGVPWKVVDRSNVINRTATYPVKYNQFLIQDDISNETVVRDNRWVYYNSVYIDTTWARVVIADAPTLAASTRREMQIPQAWSDRSISVVLNRGAFSSLSDAGLYLYVFDASGNVNTNGYPLCSSGCSPLTPPATPTTLQVR